MGPFAIVTKTNTNAAHVEPRYVRYGKAVFRKRMLFCGTAIFGWFVHPGKGRGPAGNEWFGATKRGAAPNFVPLVARFEASKPELSEPGPSSSNLQFRGGIRICVVLQSRHHSCSLIKNTRSRCSEVEVNQRQHYASENRAFPGSKTMPGHQRSDTII